jgi:hypothetical protein
MFDGLTTGRVVHYGDDCKAGIVSHVWSKDTGCINGHRLHQRLCVHRLGRCARCPDDLAHALGRPVAGPMALA